MTPDTVFQLAEKSGAVDLVKAPEALPAFPQVATWIDRYMRKVPWWVLVVGVAATTHWLSRRKARTGG